MLCLELACRLGVLRQVRTATSCSSGAREYCHGKNSGSLLSGISTHEALANAFSLCFVSSVPVEDAFQETQKKSREDPLTKE